MWPFVSFPSKLSMNRAWRRWGNFPLVFKLLETYMSPHIPCLILLPALLTDVLRRRFIPVYGSVCVCVCNCVCLTGSLKGGAGCGAEGVFQSSCTSVGCISLGVPCFLVVREGYHPYHFFLKLSYFLPLIAHNKLSEAHTHTLLSQEARQRFPATPWERQVRPNLAVPADLAAFVELLIWSEQRLCTLFRTCLLHNLVQSVYTKLLIGS